MGVETIVFFSRARMPAPAAWQAQISAIEPGLVIDTDFDPFEFSGYLPCQIAGTACGFEYFVDVLDLEANAGISGLRPEWDGVLILVTRSSQSDCRAALIAATAFALGVDGAVLDDQETGVLAGDPLSAWLAKALRSQELDEQASREKEARRELAQAAGPELELGRILTALVGRRGELLCRMGSLALKAPPDLRIASGAWRVTVADHTYDCCRYAALREEQIELLNAAAGEPPGPRFGELESLLDAAGDLDERDAEAFADALLSLGEVKVLAARIESPGALVLELQARQPILACWYGMGTSSLSINAEGLQWTIRSDGEVLM